MSLTYAEASTIQYARTDLEPMHIGVHRWYLRHDAPWTVERLEPPRDGLTFQELMPITLNSYRTLYDGVGLDWLWGDRRRMDQAQLERDLTGPGVIVQILKAEQETAGFYELNTRRAEVTDIAYFGLMPGFIGSGLGPWMLREAIAHAAHLRRVPVTLNTCTLDHPKALRNYQNAGLKVIEEEQEDTLDPRLDGTLPRHVAPHVPLGAS
jgi:GNAT superfamily N-acetyltransferase